MFNQKEILKLASFLIICNLLAQSPAQKSLATENKAQTSKIIKKSSLNRSEQNKLQSKLQNKEHEEHFFPGIYISDTENRWHVSDYKHEEGEQFGYVICKGGYIGSPLIPNDKATVDKFLDYCKTNKKVGPGNLPIIDVASNHQPSETSYKAYTVPLGGQKLFLCRGYLNSTENCSYEGDKQVGNMMSRIKKGLPLDSQFIVERRQEGRQDSQESFSTYASLNSSQNLPEQSVSQTRAEVLPLEAKPLVKKPLQPIQSNFQVDSSKLALTEEIAREISRTLTPENSSNTTKIKLEAIPLSALAADKNNNLASQALQITPEEFEALKAGRITLSDLTERSANNSLPSSNTPTNSTSRKAIQITPSELEALQNGRISLEQLASGKQLMDVNSSGQPVLAQSVLTQQPENLKKGLQVTASEAEDLKAGRVSIEQLLSNRSLVDLNSPGNPPSLQPSIASSLPPGIPAGLPPVLNGMSTAGAKVLPLSPETLAALQNGSININQVIQGASQQSLNPGNPVIIGNNPNLLQMQQPMPPGYLTQQLPPEISQQISQQAPQQIPQQILQQEQQQAIQLSNMQTLAPSQFPLAANQVPGNYAPNYPQAQQFTPQQFLAQPTQMQAPEQLMQASNLQNYGSPQTNPQFMNGMPQGMPFEQNQMMNGMNSYPQTYAPEGNSQVAYQGGYDQNNGLQINGPQGAIPDYGNVSYQDYYEQPTQNGVSYAPLAWSGYYFNQRYYGPPMTYATNAIYGTHSNTVYWPGMRSGY